MYVSIRYDAVEPFQLKGLAGSNVVVRDKVIDEGQSHFMVALDNLQWVCVCMCVCLCVCLCVFVCVCIIVMNSVANYV